MTEKTKKTKGLKGKEESQKKTLLIYSIVTVPCLPDVFPFVHQTMRSIRFLFLNI